MTFLVKLYALGFLWPSGATATKALRHKDSLSVHYQTTILLIPSLMRGTLKLIKYPNLLPVSFK